MSKKPHIVSVHVRLTQSVRQQAKVLAAKAGQSESKFCAVAIESQCIRFLLDAQDSNEDAAKRRKGESKP